MSSLAFDELMDVAEDMAQELLEFIEAGEESGSDMAAPRETFERFQALWRKSGNYWGQDELASSPQKQLACMEAP